MSEAAVAEKIYYGNTVLKGTQKSGELKPDGNGYYTVVLGALGVQNSVGEEYVNTAKARSTFEQNSSLMRRISQGLLRGEWGHPDPSQYPNMMLFDKRVRTIKEDRISHHISAIWLEKVEYMGMNVLGILGKIRPSGPFGPALKDALENPNENVTFSGRYFSNISKEGGRIQREIHTVATWDFVSEPGIAQSSKYASPTLESFGEAIFHSAMLQAQARTEEKNRQANEEYESASLESKGEIITADQILRDFELAPKRQGKPKSMNW